MALRASRDLGTFDDKHSEVYLTPRSSPCLRFIPVVIDADTRLLSERAVLPSDDVYYSTPTLSLPWSKFWGAVRTLTSVSVARGTKAKG